MKNTFCFLIFISILYSCILLKNRAISKNLGFDKMKMEYILDIEYQMINENDSLYDFIDNFDKKFYDLNQIDLDLKNDFLIGKDTLRVYHVSSSYFNDIYISKRGDVKKIHDIDLKKKKNQLTTFKDCFNRNSEIDFKPTKKSLKGYTCYSTSFVFVISYFYINDGEIQYTSTIACEDTYNEVFCLDKKKDTKD